MNSPDLQPAVLDISTSDADLALVYPWLDEAAKADALPAKLLGRMHVALDEVVLNVARHAYPEGKYGRIVVEYRSDPEHATLLIRDTGKAFNPLEAPEMVHQEGADAFQVGGNGITLLRHFCKDISYRYRNGENELKLRFLRQIA